MFDQRLNILPLAIQISLDSPSRLGIDQIEYPIALLLTEDLLIFATKQSFGRKTQPIVLEVTDTISYGEPFAASGVVSVQFRHNVRADCFVTFHAGGEAKGFLDYFAKSSGNEN